MKKIAYREMFENEMTHAWYMGTRNLMVKILKKNHLSLKSIILDAGCGTGGTMKLLGGQGFNNLKGIDISQEAVRFCKKRGLKNVRVGSLHELPYEDLSFDTVICLDVLSQKGINVKKVLGEFGRVLKTGGLLYLQEPSYNWLKSGHDQVVEIEHRFTKSEIEKTIKSQGFKIIKSTCFNLSFLLPIALNRLASRILNKKSKFSDVRQLPPFLNSLFFKVLLLEIKFVSAINLPFGLSVVCVSCKKSNNRDSNN